MITDWAKARDEVLSNPFFDDVTPVQRQPTPSDRLAKGFVEITEFVKNNGRLPNENGEGEERRLSNYLKGILSNADKIAVCRPYDTEGILPQDDQNTQSDKLQGLNQTQNFSAQAEKASAKPLETESSKRLTEPETQEEILASIFEELDDEGSEDDDDDIFNLPAYMQKKLEERKEPDYIGRMRKCEDFERYEDGFKNIHAGLRDGTFRLIKFSLPMLQTGRYLVDEGMVLYVAGLSEKEKNKHGRLDARTRIIYENGLESDITYRTLLTKLSKTGLSVEITTQAEKDELAKHFAKTEGDIESGLIYVLKSLSTREDIVEIPHLYKIGFTTTTVESRIAGAKNDPTYLCAPVEIVASWRIYNVKSSTLERLIHKLFGSVQLNVLIDNKRPKEWFCVPLRIIKQAIEAIIAGKPVAYNLDLQELVYLTPASAETSEEISMDAE